MDNVRLEIHQANSTSPTLLARFELAVDIGEGMVLRCCNGAITRGRTDPNKLYVVYPKTYNVSGKPFATWLFDKHGGQEIFDDWVISAFADYQKSVNFECTEPCSN